MPQQPPLAGGYLSTDPNAGLAATPPPTKPTYLSTDPNAGLSTGRGRGAGPAPQPPSRGRGAGPGTTTSASQPPPASATEFYPGGSGALAQDIGGMAGGVLATTAATALLPAVPAVAGIAGVTKMLPWAARALRGAAGVAGAGVGGGVAAAATGSPLTAGEDQDSVVHAIRNQAEMEAIGLGTGWGASALGRRALASKVGRNASEWLNATKTGAVEQFQSILDSAQDALRSHAAAGASSKLTRAGQVAGLEGAQAAGQARTAGLRAQWPAASPPAQGISPAARATAKVEGVVSGPARASLDKLGAAVEHAAESGPEVPWAPLRTKLESMHARTQPTALASTATEATPLTTQQQVSLGRSHLSEDDFRAALGLEGVELETAHPLPGVLGKLQAVKGDTVSYLDAHRFKRLLDDAINWAPPGAVRTPARPQLKAITKGIRGQLREAMAGHAPYDQATAAYASASTLFGPKGLARQIQASARANPDALLKGIRGHEPTKLQMLKEVLLHHAEEGGGPEGAQAGHEAWDAVRSAWTHEHLIKPGIDRFDASLAKLHPETVHALYGDPAGQQVLGRLRQMSGAVQSSVAQTAQTVGAKQGVKAAGKLEDAQHAVAGTQLQTDRLAASRDLRAARQPTPAEQAFDRSSLARPATPGQVGGDVAYAAMAPPGSPRQVAGLARLGLRGPKVNDLIRWASLSDTGTQWFVWAITGPAPGQAVAAMLRAMEYATGEAGPEPSRAATPPPQPARAATPPPGPPR